MRVARTAVVAGVVLVVVACTTCLAPAAPPAAPRPKVTKWVPLYEAALLQAGKEKKPILAYFCGSDWEPFTAKLEKEVLNTDMFRDWAADHVILFQVDFPKEKHLSVNIKSQNDRLKTRYSIITVPTFILMDSSGLPFNRSGFDEAKLRDEEPKGAPKAWIKYLEESIKNKPPDEELIKQKNLTECLAYAKKHFLSAVLVINQGRAERPMAVKEEVTHNQQFVRYMNRNVAYAEIEWPFDSDTSPEALAFRQFVAEQKLEPAPLQLVVWDMQTRKVKMHVAAIDANRVDFLVSMVENQLPRLDYNGGWIEDYRMAQAVSQQQKRYIFLAFTSMDSSEFSRKMDEEIFQSEEFKAFARKKLVTVRIDFPATATQPTALASQNKMLAEMFAIRGYPSVIVLNLQLQKIANAKYMKGGPEAFLKELSAAVKNDEDRRAFLAGEQ